MKFTVFIIIFCFTLVGYSYSNHSYAQNLEIDASEFLEWDQNAMSYIAKGDAVAKQGDRLINADKIIAYYEDKDSRDITRIEAIGNVSFIDEDRTGAGAKMVYNMIDKSLGLTGEKVSYKSEKITANSSKSILYQENDGVITLESNVIIALTGDNNSQTISAEFVKILLDDDGQVSIINANNNVKLAEDNGRIAYSDSAIYNAVSGTTDLEGSVEIYDGQNLLRGDKANINMVTGYSKIIAEGANQRVSGKLILGTSN